MGAGLTARQIYDRKRTGVKKMHRRLLGMGINTTIKGEYLEWNGPRGAFRFFYRIIRASNAEVAGLPTITSQIDGQTKKFEGWGGCVPGDKLDGSFEDGMKYLQSLDLGNGKGLFEALGGQ